jgi:Zn ribbon nucleic-acid-binding protein
MRQECPRCGKHELLAIPVANRVDHYCKACGFQSRGKPLPARSRTNSAKPRTPLQRLAANSGLHGLGGWLILPLLGLFLSALLSILTVASSFSAGTADAFLAGEFVVLVWTIAMIWLFLAKFKILPLLIVIYYAVGIVFNVGARVAGESAQPGLLQGVIWIGYFLTSVRVKNTFVR